MGAVSSDAPRIGAEVRRSANASLPATPADSYRELVELDRAHSIRWARQASSQASLQPDGADLAILELVADLGHVLTSQVHRRFNPRRAATTTQRRLKRLSDAGLLERFQFHRRDGGGVPMCYAITAAGRALLRANGRVRAFTDEEPHPARLRPEASRSSNERWLRQARHDVHVAAWVLAVERVAGAARCTLRGAADSVLSPPTRSLPEGRITLGPAELRLPGGRTAHDFLCTGPDGECVEIERFETVRPDAIVELTEYRSTPVVDRGSQQPADADPPTEVASTMPATPARAIDLIIELDDRLPAGRSAAKLERYDHFLAGWSEHTSRYGRRREALPVAVFVCRDRARARDCARRADTVLRACRAYAGEYPFDWEYPGRERVLFVSERDMHEGLTRAFGVLRLPPEVRVTVARGDPRAAEAIVEQRQIPDGAPQG